MALYLDVLSIFNILLYCWSLFYCISSYRNIIHWTRG